MDRSPAERAVELLWKPEKSDRRLASAAPCRMLRTHPLVPLARGLVASLPAWAYRSRHLGFQQAQVVEGSIVEQEPWE